MAIRMRARTPVLRHGALGARIGLRGGARRNHAVAALRFACRTTKGRCRHCCLAVHRPARSRRGFASGCRARSGGAGSARSTFNGGKCGASIATRRRQLGAGRRGAAACDVPINCIVGRLPAGSGRQHNTGDADQAGTDRDGSRGRPASAGANGDAGSSPGSPAAGDFKGFDRFASAGAMQCRSLRGQVRVVPCRGLHLPALRRRTAQLVRTEHPVSRRAAANGAGRNRFRIRLQGYSGRRRRDPETGNAGSGRSAMQRRSLRGQVRVFPCRGLHLPALRRRTAPHLRAIGRAPSLTRGAA